MTFDATFWVAISFIIFFSILIYLKVPNKINELLSRMIFDIKNEIEESEKLRIEAKVLLDKAQSKLDSAKDETKKILDEANEQADNLKILMNDRFHKSSEIRKNIVQKKISQMKENAINEIKNASIKIAVDSVKKVISGSIDKSKLDALFEKNLIEIKEELKRINS